MPLCIKLFPFSKFLKLTNQTVLTNDNIVKLRRVKLLTKLNLRATGCHLPYGITYYPTQVNTPCCNPGQRPGPVHDLPTPEGWKAELTLMEK